LKLGERVRMNLDPNLKKTDLSGRPCRITIRLKNGQTFSREAQHAKGGPEHPLSEEELKAKFRDCAEQAIDQTAAERALAEIERLDDLPSIAPLCDILRG
jgi:2-methylcitrate dehydratase PrpD